MKRKILIVEDDRDLNSTVDKFLKIKGFETASVYDGDSAIDIAYEKEFDIVLLDVKLPYADGFEVAKEIRSSKNTPIIFLTSLNSEKDVEKGFVSGGDDYITKPFSLNELLLRINAILRRVYKNENIINITEKIKFNTENLTLIKDDEPVHLTAKEVRLMSLFLQNRDKIVSRKEIFDSVYEYEEEPNEASLRVFINRLRNIIGKHRIQTIKNIGYQYVG